MRVDKQHIVLNLIKSGRYTSNQETGEIISNIGNEPRIIRPIALYNGYLQYRLDLGFNEHIMVYGHQFSYLARWMTTYDPKFVIDHIDNNKTNNHPDNLRCITQRENTEGNVKNRGKGSKTRLPADQREQIRQLHSQGVSAVKIAAQFNITRQTVAKIVLVK